MSNSVTTQPIRSTAARNVPEQVEQRPPTVAPFVDVFENANEIVLWADVPGATRESVVVHVDKGQLTLSARRADAAPKTAGGEGKAAALEIEQRPYDYQRLFTVPTGIDASKIEAELSAGVLKVRLPKSEALRPRRIEVKAT